MIACLTRFWCILFIFSTNAWYWLIWIFDEISNFICGLTLQNMIMFWYSTDIQSLIRIKINSSAKQHIIKLFGLTLIMSNICWPTKLSSESTSHLLLAFWQCIDRSYVSINCIFSYMANSKDIPILYNMSIWLLLILLIFTYLSRICLNQSLVCQKFHISCLT